MNSLPEVTFHGAARTVTGSCTELRVGDHRILIDCGLFQGSRTLERLNHEKFDFDPRQIEAVILTHAHIDHSGLLPKLVAHGFTGHIWCTPQSRDLLEVMLADAARIQESEADRRNRRRDRADSDHIAPAYTQEDAWQAWQQCQPIPLDEWFRPAPGMNARLWNAGHILGSASVELEAGGVRLLFSGDIGPENKVFLPDPAGAAGFDHVFCESTYGDRIRDANSIAQRRELLRLEIEGALQRGGNLVIPAFALERTQELLLDIAHLQDSGRIGNVPVFVDSPLANRTTEIFARYVAELEDIGDSNVFRHPSFHYVDAVPDSIRLNSLNGAIIMAASGMCEAGRIRHHLKHNLPNRNSTILFVGFQAEGTLGRVLQDGARRVRISGSDVCVRAQIRRIEGYSAHADQGELLAWIEARRPISGSLILVHGEADSIEALRRLAQSRDAAATIVTPQIGESYLLGQGTPAKRTATARQDVQELIGRDWQNSYADFAVNLKRELARIRDDRARQRAIDEMRKVLDSYADFKREREDRKGH